MGLFSKDIKTLHDLYMHGLQDLYYAENQIMQALPSMIEKAHNRELKRGLQQHLGQTKQQLNRLEDVFRLHDEEAKGTKCPAIDGIIKEGNDLMSDVADPEVLGVGIIAAGQAVEHYEITRYGALIAWAKELGHSRDATILARNLSEEKAMDKGLTRIAEARVNPRSIGAAERPARASNRRKGSTSRAAHSAGHGAAGRRNAASRRKPVQKRRKGSSRA